MGRPYMALRANTLVRPYKYFLVLEYQCLSFRAAAVGRPYMALRANTLVRPYKYFLVLEYQ
ncbi:MAG: hypothetical protein AB1403_17585, partial [Candidatus Riflebacteria bacterium]